MLTNRTWLTHSTTKVHLWRLAVFIFCFQFLTANCSPWLQLLNALSQTSQTHDTSICGTTVWTNFHFCDPGGLLSVNDQNEIIFSIHNFSSSRFHRCEKSSDTEALRLSVVIGSSNLAKRLNSPLEDFIEELLDLIIQKQSNTNFNDLHFQSPTRCGNRIAIMIVPSENLTEAPILSVRCEHSLEPVFLESDYAELHKALVTAFIKAPRLQNETETVVFANGADSPKTETEVLQGVTTHSLKAKIQNTLSVLAERFPSLLENVNASDHNIVLYHGKEFKKSLYNAALPKNLQKTLSEVEETVGAVEEEAVSDLANAMLQSDQEASAGAFHHKGTESRGFWDLVSDPAVRRLFFWVMGIILIWNLFLEILRQILQKKKQKRLKEESYISIHLSKNL